MFGAQRCLFLRKKNGLMIFMLDFCCEHYSIESQYDDKGEKEERAICDTRREPQKRQKKNNNSIKVENQTEKRATNGAHES